MKCEVTDDSGANSFFWCDLVHYVKYKSESLFESELHVCQGLLLDLQLMFYYQEETCNWATCYCFNDKAYALVHTGQSDERHHCTN